MCINGTKRSGKAIASMRNEPFLSRECVPGYQRATKKETSQYFYLGVPNERYNVRDINALRRLEVYGRVRRCPQGGGYELFLFCFFLRYFEKGKIVLDDRVVISALLYAKS